MVDKKRGHGILEPEQKYRSLFENAVEGIFQSTPEGRFLTVNLALARNLGYPSPEDVISSIQDIAIQLWVDAERRKEFVHLIDKNEAVRGFECQLFRKDKSIIWISLCAIAIRDTDGKMLWCEGSAEEITERKRQRRRLGKVRTNSEKRNVWPNLEVGTGSLRVTPSPGRRSFTIFSAWIQDFLPLVTKISPDSIPLKAGCFLTRPSSRSGNRKAL